MERKKLLKKMAIIAGIVALVSAAALLFESVYTEKRNNERIQKRNNQIVQSTDQYQKFLDKIAEKINDSNINPEIIAEVNSEILKRMPGAKLYLWMSDSNSEFVFGVPAPVFIRLNKTYDRYRNIFEKDGYYVNRDDFLEKLVLSHDDINFSKFNFPSDIPDSDTKNIEKWRFIRSRLGGIFYSRSILLKLSSPVFNPDNQILGQLYLVVEDFNQQMKNRLFENSFFEGLFNFLHVIFGFSLFFLWMLIPSWVYIDARQHEQRNAVKWALLTVISFGFAAIIYLIVRPSGQKNFQCPKCQKELNGTKSYCPYCGFDLSATFCPQCQYPLRPEWKFCPSCRFDILKKPEKENKKNRKEMET